MNNYIILANFEKYSLEKMISAYQRDGWVLVCQAGECTALKKTETKKDETVETRLLEMICRSFSRGLRGTRTAVADVSELMNRHIDRLTENKMASLKFHDRFNDELRQIVTRALIGEDL